LLIPLLKYQQVCDLNVSIIELCEQAQLENISFISVSALLLSHLSEDAFALEVIDESMIPELRVNDILVIDPKYKPGPGDYVLVKIAKSEAVICQYKKLSYSSSEFELITLNDNWPNLKVSDDIEVNILGTVLQNIRSYNK
jgi:SOS-response transcriptional repressor LexA